MPTAGDMEIAVVDTANKEVGKVALPVLFADRVNDSLLFDEVLAQRANHRRGTATTKGRGQVRGGGKKPWRQKGSGRARAGSIRSPLWRGGGTTFGPSYRSYGFRLPKKARRAALRSALAQKVRDDQLRVLEAIHFDAPKTKLMCEMLDSLEIRGSVLVLLPERDPIVELSARNLPRVTIATVDSLNVYGLLCHDTLLVVRDALARIEERLGQ